MTEAAQAPSVLVVMGVAGSGKTTLSRLLAQMLHWQFLDGDALHPAANVQKMRKGVPLTDEDRWPWLHAVAAWIDATRAAGHGVVACSALKRRYRDVLLGDRGDVRLVYLDAGEDIVRERLMKRAGHFMPVSLLESQFDALEPPASDEAAIVVSVAGEPAAIASEVIERLGLTASG
jgi:carbohydrate kinase (thermoresistant glucokinase family)